MENIDGFELIARVFAFHDGLFSEGIDFTRDPFASVAFDKVARNPARDLREDAMMYVVTREWFKDYGLNYFDIMDMDFQELTLLKKMIDDHQTKKGRIAGNLISEFKMNKV